MIEPAIVPPVPSNRERLLFSVKENPQFPADLWADFRAACRANGHRQWIDVLRELIEGYITRVRAEQERKP